MSEIDRLYSYRTLLTGRRAVPRTEILSKLEISPATFKRDLSKLRDRLNIPVVFDRDLGGYRLEKADNATELPGFWFSQDEILALMTIQSMIVQLEPGLLGPKLKPFQKRLDDMLAIAWPHDLAPATLAFLALSATSTTAALAFQTLEITSCSFCLNALSSAWRACWRSSPGTWGNGANSCCCANTARLTASHCWRYFSSRWCLI